jgi:hypothetical protein
MIQIKSEQQVLQEGLHILLSNMEPSQVARFWAACSVGSGDYLKLKDELAQYGQNIAVNLSLLMSYGEFQNVQCNASYFSI